MQLAALRHATDRRCVDPPGTLGLGCRCHVGVEADALDAIPTNSAAPMTAARFRPTQGARRTAKKSGRPIISAPPPDSGRHVTTKRKVERAWILPGARSAAQLWSRS